MSITLALIPNIALAVRADDSIEQAKHLIKSHEGFAAKRYTDGNCKRIGYGSYAGSRTSITEEEADSLLEIKVISCLSYIEKHITVELSSSQMAALLDHVYNVGSLSNKLKRYVNNKDTAQVSELLSDYQYGRIVRNGQLVKVRMRGLVLRSSQRAQLYSGDYRVDLDESNRHRIIVREEDELREDTDKPFWRLFFGSSIGDSGQSVRKGYIKPANGQSWEVSDKGRVCIRTTSGTTERVRLIRLCPIPRVGYSGCNLICEWDRTERWL